MEDLDQIRKELTKVIALVYGPKNAEEHAYLIFESAAGKILETRKPWKDLSKIIKEEIKYFNQIQKNSPQINQKKNQKLVKLILELSPGNPKKALEEMAEILMKNEFKSRKQSTKFYRDILIDILEGRKN